ncbi:hypothetical protein CWE12_07660 [Aliidiomarina sedimenti]|uniref:Ancillary SecYEG translocon subunit n=2 Tax=Aliidiomarina TaxID=1249554 RepID=A0A432WC79_9GAMM|nr:MULTISPECIES: tetratricopeptide repeat protein [Aliidiomarina]RUO29674.1 hypothetical protein CWE14_14565 [Aliidiomarina soli]RUO29839.1 hypothetical protein CWE12_07660 [Aliidiomarina sedimenti]
MEHEDQQVEQIKQFMREYGIWIGAGVVIGLGSLFAWRAYDASQIEAQQQRTAAYEQISQQVQQGDEEALAQAEDVLSQLDESSQAALAHLQLARQAVDADDLSSAADHLYSAQQKAGSSVVSGLATTRLARVQLALGEYDAALQSLQQSLPQSFTAQVEEIRGDVYLAQGNPEQARAAYQAAVDLGGAQSSPGLQFKFENLAGEL